MKTVIIGGGKGCRAIIELAMGAFLKELPLDVICVADPDSEASGMVFARRHGLPTTSDMDEAIQLEGLELIIELTGLDSVLRQIYQTLPPGVKLIDHTFAHIFWDLVNAREDQKRKVRQLTELEHRIEREKDFLQQLVSSIPDLLCVVDDDLRILRTNDAFRRFANTSLEDCVGHTCVELLSDTELGKHCGASEMTLRKIFATGDPQAEILLTTAPDEAHWEASRTPFKNEQGKVKAVLCSWHKITEKVRLRREIEAAEQRFKAFIDSAHDWISIKDQDGRYVIVNPVCARAFNRTPEEFVGKTAADILDGTTAYLIASHDLEALGSNQPRTFDEVYVIDGRNRHFQTQRFPLRDYKGSSIGVCTIARDVTAEKDLGEQLVQTAKLAAVGKLAAGVAHEINNPLTGVLAFAEDMRDELRPDDPMRGDVEVIIRETLRCRNIVRNLLDFARQDVPQLKEVALAKVIERALVLVRKLPQYRNIEIESTSADDVPLVRGDVRQLQQVILNLMDNAAEAMAGKGAIKLSIAYERRIDRCVISVEDNGPGIPENLIDKIFEPFFSTKQTNGLGLAVSWGIVERHRGTIEIDMADDGGAIFRILLPPAVSSAPAEGKQRRRT